MEQEEVYSVSGITLYIKHLLEEDPLLQEVEVRGEVSNLTYHRSGHVYFSVKDAQAQLSCAMFKSFAQRAEKIQEGDEIIVSGDISVYAPRGNYQLLVKKVRKGGKGDLHQQFVLLKEKLKSEGLFDSVRKQPIPILPRQIAVVTSPTGAAVRDIIRTLRRRYPAVHILLFPTHVQGTRGAQSIVDSLEKAAQTHVDVIILARGGGSLEDLWNFNEERVVRAMAELTIPIITGIGHETDFTLADFVADYRASTPTSAAEKAVPDRYTLLQTLGEYTTYLTRSLSQFVDFKRQLLDDYTNRLQQASKQVFQKQQHQLEMLQAQIEGLDMTKTLSRGYTLTLKEGLIVNKIEEIAIDDTLEQVFQDGRAKTVVTETTMDTTSHPDEDK